MDINADVLCEQLQQLKNDKGFVKVDIKQRQTKSENGLTHFIEVDKWVPTNQSNNNTSDRCASIDRGERNSDDVPF